MIGHRLQRTGIEQAGNAVATVAAPVDQCFEAHSGDRSVFFDTGLEAHTDRVTSTMTEKDLFAGQCDLDRPSQLAGRLGDDDLVVENIALATESSAVGTGDDTDVRRIGFQYTRQRTVYIVRALRTRPERQFAVRVDRSDRCVLFDRQMCVALKKEIVFEYFVRFFERLVHIAKIEGDPFVNVALFAVFMDTWFGVFETFLRVVEGAQSVVLYVDILHRLKGGRFVDSDDRRDRIADITNP